MLDLACGTGRILIPCLQAGVDVEGVDLHLPMLQRLRDKAHLTTTSQIETLECCRDHLVPGGILAIDAFFPGLEIISLPNNTRVLELETRHPEEMDQTP